MKTCACGATMWSRSKSGQCVDCYTESRKTAIPEGFAEWAKVESDSALKRRFNLGETTVRRMRRTLGIPNPIVAGIISKRISIKTDAFQPERVTKEHLERSSRALVAATMAAFARIAEREGVSIEIAGLRCLYGREAAAVYEREAA